MIIVYLSGGLGNQMFEYSFGRYLSLKHGVPLKFDISMYNDKAPRKGYTPRTFDLAVFNIEGEVADKADIPFSYRRYFSGKAMRVIEGLRRKILKNPGKEKHFHFDPNAINLGPSTYLEGYWQSPKYFDSIKDILKKDFTLKKPLPEKSQQLFNEIKNSNSACIFVRRADYVGSALHETVTLEYYDRAIEMLQKSRTVEKLYIFSDDLEWCRNNMNFDLLHMFVGNEHAGEKFEGKMIMMSACRHFIIPNSTFAWWAAWLGDSSDKIVIAPKAWFGNSSINTNDVTPVEWIRI